MKFAIILLLLSSMFLLPAQGFAQQSSNGPVPAQAPIQQKSLGELAREQRALTAVRNSLNELCGGKMKDDEKCKLAVSDKAYSEELIKKTVAENLDIQTYIKTGVLPDKPIKTGLLPAPDKSNADTLNLDKSWMDAGLRYQQQEASGTSASQRVTVADSLGDLETQMSVLADKTPRELGEEYARDIKFPGRERWEQDLYSATAKFVAATRGWIAVMRSSNASKGALDEAALNMKVAQLDCSRLHTFGIDEAAKWERGR
jgi:hypothetical protein